MTEQSVGIRGEDSTEKIQRWLLLAGLVVTNVLVIGLTVDSLARSRRQHDQDARSLTQNVSNALDLNLSKSFEKVDLVLRAVVDELERQLAGKGINEKEANAFLALQEQRLPEVEAFRVARSDGVVILGKGLVKGAGASWADREDFIFHRSHGDSGLQISKARMGRVAKQYIVGFSRRYNHPDGGFAGTVSAPISVDQFTRLLSQFDVGSKGALVLRDVDLGLITRVPPMPNNPAGQVGNQVVSDDFRRVFESGKPTATDYTTQSPDGYQRIFTFHRLQAAPMVTIVAVSTQDYLKSWNEELVRACAMVFGFLFLSILLGVSQIFLLRQNERHSRELREDRSFISNILDSLGEHVAVIDGQGVITAVNSSWRRFAAENGAQKDADAFIGTNYLGICMGAVGSPRGEESMSAYDGIKAVLMGTQRGFSLKYPCHSPTEQRWFILYAMPLMGTHQGAVLIHQNVSEQHRAEVQLRASEEHFRMLAENMSDLVWKADAKMRFTYINDADRRLRGFEREEVLGRSIAEALTPEGKAILTDLVQERRSVEASDRRGVALAYDIPMRRKNGGQIWMEISTTPFYDGEGKIAGFQGVGRDISERKMRESEFLESHFAMEEQLIDVSKRKSELEMQVVRDPLTQVYNRRYLDETLPRELSRARREAYPVAIIMIDLDHFKHVNDQYGHAAGDHVLKGFAALLTRGARDSDMVCRYGGEEFVVIMPRLTAERALERVEAWRVEQQAMTLSYIEHEISITLSAGIAVYPDNGDTSELLLARADAMLYCSKNQGRNCITVYCD